MVLQGLTTAEVLCSTLLLDNLEILIINGNIHLIFANNQISSIFGEKKETLITSFHLFLAFCSFCISLLLVEDTPSRVC